tara:strand:+ start:543 stop:809 length:267 start_codon:yes stop_codon:yes gene_type:complete
MTQTSTLDAAEFMLKAGQWYTSATLGEALGVSAKTATGLIYNIRTTTKAMVFSFMLLTSQNYNRFDSIIFLKLLGNTILDLCVFGTAH